MKLWPFAVKPLLDPETAAWHRENFRWLVETFGAVTGFDHRQLIVPAPSVFTTNKLGGHALAEHILAQVKLHAGLTDWDAELVADDSVPPEDGSDNIVKPVHGKFAAGTFSLGAGNRIRITYATRSLAEPEILIATLAHELAHYLLATAPGELPVPDDEHEFLTDLAAVFLGFGTFLANSAFTFQQFQDGMMQGWKTSRLGYLPETDLVFATALFLKARGAGPEAAKRYLKPHLGKMLERAMAQVSGL